MGGHEPGSWLVSAWCFCGGWKSGHTPPACGHYATRDYRLCLGNAQTPFGITLGLHDNSPNLGEDGG